MSIAEELEKLQQLHQSGAIDDGEYSIAKSKVLNGSSWASTGKTTLYEEIDLGPAALDEPTRRWAFLLHLSVLAGFAFPIAGLIIPIVIWQMKKYELPGIDVHGINAINWIISLMIYTVVCAILVFAIIGIPMLIALGLVAVVFPIVAAIKANNGEVWKYPLSISFLKTTWST